MHRLLMLAAAALLTTAGFAAEVYIVQGEARGPFLANGGQVFWSTDAYFYNGSAATARVRLLGMSNMAAPEPARELTLAPGRTAALLQAAPTFRPPALPPLWIVRADVPEGVAVESILLVGTIVDRPPLPLEIRRYEFGKTRLPVFRSLVAAGQPQPHLATFLGPESRINVAVYNAATTAATARIEIRRHCDDTLVDERIVSLPPDTLIQFGGFSAQHGECGATPSMSGPGVYTIVTVDRPSLSFVSNVANAYSPVTSFSVTSTP